MDKDRETWNEFRNVWPVSRVKIMTLEEYTNVGKKDTFTYWIESKLDKLGSIWGGSSFKFGIYSRNDKETKANVGGRMYSDKYGWMSKYGTTETEAFENVKAQIIETVDAVQKNELERIDQVDLGGAFKWKIAFHFQNSLDQPVCINIFSRRALEAISQSPQGTPRNIMQRKLISNWDKSDILLYSKDLWQKYSKDIPTTPEQIIEAEVYSETIEEVKPTIAVNEHTEIQYLLLRLGSDLGLEVWVARNDRNKQFNGVHFSTIPHIQDELKLPFESKANRIIELIDVLWIKGSAIVAAFEIESTTSIYSGLLRMSDLITFLPNLNIPLFLVAPDERSNKVMAEINRPTFANLDPPLYEICRLISFSKLRDGLEQIKSIIKHVKPDVLQSISESCQPEDL